MRRAGGFGRVVAGFLASASLAPGLAGAYRGPRGGTAVVGPRGGAAVRGPYGGAAVRGPYGGAAVRAPGRAYAYGGHRYYRPAFRSTTIVGFGRPYVGYPGWRAYGTYGLAPGLVAFSSLAFLSTGLLVGSYLIEQNRTVYVYVVQEDDVYKEYKVDSTGKVLSTRIVPNPEAS